MNMKKVLITIFLLSGINLIAQNGSVSVDITGVVAEWGGELRFGLFDKSGFPREGKALVSRIVPVRDIKANIVLGALPEGNYAIAIYQDLNNDGKINKTIYGLPTEPYAFSNNVFGRFGPPKFADTEFWVASGDTTSLTIHLE